MSLPTPSQEPDPLADTPAAFCPEMADLTSSQGRLNADLCAILQALPTKSDIEALILRIEEAHSRDIHEVRTELHSVADRVTSGEVTSLMARVQALEWTCESHWLEAQEMQLHLEEMEDRSLRNNLRLRGIPEATGLFFFLCGRCWSRAMGVPPHRLKCDFRSPSLAATDWVMGRLAETLPHPSVPPLSHSIHATNLPTMTSPPQLPGLTRNRIT